MVPDSLGRKVLCVEQDTERRLAATVVVASVPAPVRTLDLFLPSPMQELDDDRLTRRDVRLYLKHDDLIHAEMPGNKWHKLKYNLGGEATLPLPWSHPMRGVWAQDASRARRTQPRPHLLPVPGTAACAILAKTDRKQTSNTRH